MLFVLQFAFLLELKHTSPPKKVDMSIKVFLADDRELLIAGLKGHLESKNIEVVGIANSADGLVEKFTKSNADVLVIDLRFRDETKTGLSVATSLLEKNPGTKIVLLSQFDDTYIIENAYKIGILAFVGKNETDNLAEAINSASKGQKYLSSLTAQKLALESIETKDPRKLLTTQEIMIFTYIADGLTPHTIANNLNVTYKTINNAVIHIRKKLGIETYPEFTKLAIKYGLITLD